MQSINDRLPGWVKLPLKSTVWRYRLATSAARSLPDIIVIGAQKSGTTSLHAWLAKHPQILPPFEKEVHYFDGGIHPGKDNYALGPTWYRAHFARQSEKASLLTFEATPMYLFHPLAAQRIHACLPNVKLIAILRNPVERAISHYFHSVKKGNESLSLADALSAEEDRLSTALTTNQYADEHFVRHSYKARGCYAEQLARYLQYFDKNQLLVLDSEGMFANPAQYLRRIYSFSGVDKDCVPDKLVPRNVAANRQPVDATVIEQLTDYFRPHNRALFDLLGEEFTWQ